MSLPANFLTKTRPADCIVWTGALNSRGYGCFGVNGKSQLAHRVAYEAAHGPIPEGLTIDHLCGFRRCVNPDHLEAVTGAENTRRANDAASVCVNGHALPTERTARGKRACRECSREYSREYSREAAAAAYAPVSVGVGEASSEEVRAWAIDEGLTTETRGNIPGWIRDAYANWLVMRELARLITDHPELIDESTP